MSTRDAILAAIRQGLGRGELDESTRRKLDERSAQPPRHIRPQVDEDDLTARFIERIESRAATTARLGNISQVPAAVAALAEKLGLPHAAMVGTAVGELNWPEGWAIDHGAAAAQPE